MRATSIQKALFSFFPILFMYRINSVAFASEAEVQVKVNDIAEIVPSTMPVSGMPNLTAQLFYFLAVSIWTYLFIAILRQKNAARKKYQSLSGLGIITLSLLIGGIYLVSVVTIREFFEVYYADASALLFFLFSSVMWFLPIIVLKQFYSCKLRNNYQLALLGISYLFLSIPTVYQLIFINQ